MHLLLFIHLDHVFTFIMHWSVIKATPHLYLSSAANGPQAVLSLVCTVYIHYAPVYRYICLNDQVGIDKKPNKWFRSPHRLEVNKEKTPG